MIPSSNQSPTPLPDGLDEEALPELEAAVVDAAEVAGAFVARCFGEKLQVELKDDATKSLVTEVDRESQRIIAGLMSDRFPAHALLGEEDPPESEQPAPEFVWAVDPIDGTTNYVNSIPSYAVSVAILFRGAPVAAACYLPWPNKHTRTIYRARLNGGAWAGDERLAVRGPDPGPGPQHGRVSLVPMGLTYMFRIDRDLRRGFGEPRVSGSLVLDLLMVASGRAQMLIGAPAAPWDYAAGMLIAREAGGAVAVPRRAEDGRYLDAWSEFDSFAPRYDETPETMRGMRNWRSPVIAGAPELVRFLAANLHPGRRSLLRRVRRSVFGRHR